MLYVFHVDVGRMLSFDMTVAMSSVENLKKCIERAHGIPANNIVLLASGGEILTHSTQVSCYSAGTDTNPIYMFLTGDMKMPTVTHLIESDQDLPEQVERSINLPPVYETVVKRAQLAARMYDLAREEERITELLVHEQHLQQQGWSTVVANMEDLTKEFQHRFKNFCEAFDKHMSHREEYLELLRNFNDDLTKLSRIPILPGLMPLAEADFHGFDEFLDNDDVFSPSHDQQESVLNVKTTIANQCDEREKENVDDSTCDKSTSSTSPNKKLKMGTDSLDERMLHASNTSTTSGNTARRLNLLQWITSKENHDTLKTMSEESAQGLATFNEKVYNNLKIEVENIIKMAEHSDVKEIKGIGDRLCKLEKFRFKIKDMVKDQKELSTALHQNQARANQERDPSILPDLCTSHQSQLLLMLQQHQKIRDHRRCIVKAKEELSMNMHSRLRRIVLIENTMSEFDNKLLFYHRCLRRAERHIHIIEQIHEAPNMYLAAVTEVMRRKIFSTEFRLWASKLAEDFDAIHSEEMKRRQRFNDNFDGHFLNILFPGMNDMPPAFANENPLIFDARLPNITRTDIDILTSHLPEMASQIQLPDMAPVIYFFVSRSGIHQRERLEEMLRQKDRLAERQETQKGKLQDGHEDKVRSAVQDYSENRGVVAMVTSGICPQVQRLTELRKEDQVAAITCDSLETDTEADFEKVSASAHSISTSTSGLQVQKPSITMVKSTLTDEIVMQNIGILTEENDDVLRMEAKRVREQLGIMSKLALDCIYIARNNLNTLRMQAESQQKDMRSTFEMLNDQWKLLRMKSDARETYITQMDCEHKEQIQHLLNTIQISNEELKTTRQKLLQMDELKTKCSDMEATIADLKNKLNNFQIEKETAISEACEKLIHEHKTEMESLRQRFKLMTSMEQRSPSNASLSDDKMEAHSVENIIDLAYHETILAQERAKLELEKEKAITAALEAERTLWQSKIIPLNSGSVMANVSILRDMLEEKERQLDQLRERDLMITKENYQLKSRLDSLTNEEGNSWLEEKIEYLNRDKRILEEELNMEKSRRLEMESSFAVLRGSTTPIPNQKAAVLQGCTKGDLVIVVWSVRHRQFLIVQDSSTLYFVHGDSLPGLNLRIPDINDEYPIPMPYYALGRVVDKEYCLTRKEENRYRLPRGCRFNRVKLIPLISKQITGKQERLESFSSTISRSISQYDSASETSAVCATSQFNLAAVTTTSDVHCVNAIKSVRDSTHKGVTNVSDNTAAVASSSSSSKERTISVTSVTEEDEEPISLLSDRYQQTSISEEDDTIMDALSSEASNVLQSTQLHQQERQQQQQLVLTTTQQQSVITEQPATSKTSKTELHHTTLISSEVPIKSTIEMDNNKITTEINSTNSNNLNSTGTTTITTSSNSTIQNTSTKELTAQNINLPLIPLPTLLSPARKASPPPLIQSHDTTLTTLPTASDMKISETNISQTPVPTSLGTTISDDSDEYRSLEPKDEEPDFPLSE